MEKLTLNIRFYRNNDAREVGNTGFYLHEAIIYSAFC